MKLAQKLLRTGKARTLRSAVRKAWREVKAKARESRKSYDRKRAQEVMRKRSKRAVTLDKKKRARTPLDFETWARRPGRYDWPGVDTPESPKSKEPEMLLVVERKHSEKGVKTRWITKFEPRPGGGVVIEERRIKDYAHISLVHVKKDVEFVVSRSGKALGLKNLRTGKVVWFPGVLVRARRTYMAIPWWLYESKKDELRKAGFAVEEK